MKYVYLILIVMGLYLLTKFVCGFVEGWLETTKHTDNILFCGGAIYGLIAAHMLK